MRSSFYHDGHYQDVAEKAKNYINSLNHDLAPENIDDTRATGSAIEALISKELGIIYLNPQYKYLSNSFLFRRVWRF